MPFCYSVLIADWGLTQHWYTSETVFEVLFVLQFQELNYRMI